MVVNNEDLIHLVATVGGLSIPILAIVLGLVTRMFSVRQRELSRREIAAYIAEGSMTVDDGERLLAAGKKGRCG